MRDGVRLNATVYLPVAESIERSPLIVLMTPYIADSYHHRGMYFASHRFAFAIVDVRGRGNSEGVFRPLIQEATDGYDVIEWIAAQPYCNGKVSMWGGSYSGYAQWAAAKAFPPHLQSVVPVAAPCAGVDFPMRNNIFCPYLVQWLAYTAGRTSQSQLFSDATFWSGLFRQWYESGNSFRALNDRIGSPFAAYDEWISHPQPDAYWDSFNPTEAEYARLSLPILTITGSYDDDQPGALAHYQRHVRACGGRSTHYLVMGPWDHAGTRSPQASFGGVTCGPESLVDLAKLHVDWYDWTLNGAERPQFLRKNVAYYVLGAERWRYAASLEAVTARHEALFLNSNGSAGDLYSSGSLEPVPARGTPDRYTFDPSHVSSLALEAEEGSSGGSLVDQSLTHALSGQQLVYHSAPFETDAEISGFFRLTAWIAIDCPDTDFFISVHEITLAGASIRLTTDAMRARYREDLRSPRLIYTREPLPYEFERFTFISRRVARGHRLRLCIAPMGRIMETTFAEKNYNTGGVVADETSRHARSVTVALFHDDAHHSVLYVPIGQPYSPDELRAPDSCLLPEPIWGSAR